MRNNSGFTLIELVIVIVILGILSAFALPRFADLGGDARRAKIEGAAGAVRSATSIVHSTCQVRENCDLNEASGSGESIELEGENILLHYGYPNSTSAGIIRAAQLGQDYHITGSTGVRRIYPNQSITQSGVTVNCRVEYERPGNAGEAPVIETFTQDC